MVFIVVGLAICLSVRPSERRRRASESRREVIPIGREPRQCPYCTPRVLIRWSRLWLTSHEKKGNPQVSTDTHFLLGSIMHLAVCVWKRERGKQNLDEHNACYLLELIISQTCPICLHGKKHECSRGSSSITLFVRALRVLKVTGFEWEGQVHW